MKKLLLPLFFLFAWEASAVPAPNFAVTTSGNQPLKLYQDFINQGKLVVIEAFFTTCPPCNTHAPLLQALYTQMQVEHPGKVEFILLSTLGTDNNVKVGQYKASKGLTMPAAGADGGSLTALQPYTSNQFGPFQGTPTFIIIEPLTGNVHFDLRGNSASQTMALLSQKINELLPAPPCTLKDFFDGYLEEVRLDIEAPGFDTSFMANGNYSLAGVPALQNDTYTIFPTLEDNPLNGVTTYDLVLISKHILGIEELACEWQLLAADVNRSGTITTSDIVTLRKTILGISQELPFGSWRFVPDSATVFEGACADFKGLKYGDVNHVTCAEVAPDPEERSTLALTVLDQTIQAGQTLALEFFSPEPLEVDGLQVVALLDHKKLIVNNITSKQLKNFNPDCYNLSHQAPGSVPISWTSIGGTYIDNAVPVMSIEITAKTDGKLSEMLDFSPDWHGIKPEIYTTGSFRTLSIQWQQIATNSQPYQLYPNPGSGTVVLSGHFDYTAETHIQVVDIQGNIIYEEDFPTLPGYNQFGLQLQNKPPGLYSWRINGKIGGKLSLH